MKQWKRRTDIDNTSNNYSVIRNDIIINFIFVILNINTTIIIIIVNLYFFPKF